MGIFGTIKDHFMRPRVFCSASRKKANLTLTEKCGQLGLRGYHQNLIKIEKETDRIKDLKWQTWGRCATAIASASAFCGNGYEKQRMKIEIGDEHQAERYRRLSRWFARRNFIASFWPTKPLKGRGKLQEFSREH